MKFVETKGMTVGALQEIMNPNGHISTLELKLLALCHVRQSNVEGFWAAAMTVAVVTAITLWLLIRTLIAYWTGIDHRASFINQHSCSPALSSLEIRALKQWDDCRND
jgi:hypothetical protein